MGSLLTRTGVLPWLQSRIVDPVLQVIRRGAEPKQLAFSAALGVTIGIFPICGTTVILGGVAITMLGSRCNGVTVMFLNLAATPLKLSLIIPFLCLGEAVTGSEHLPLTADVGLADCCTICAGRVVHGLGSLFQDPGGQVWQHTFEPQDTMSRLRRSRAACPDSTPEAVYDHPFLVFGRSGHRQ